MTLGQEQEVFTRHLVLLIQKAWELGFTVRIGEVMRTPEQQQLYFDSGKSKTMNSMHLKKCAADLHLFKNFIPASVNEIRLLGTYWESLSVQNRWGGSWRGAVEAGLSSFVDSPHFERQV